MKNKPEYVTEFGRAEVKYAFYVDIMRREWRSNVHAGGERTPTNIQASLCVHNQNQLDRINVAKFKDMRVVRV
jgi:hypothetical protein